MQPRWAVLIRRDAQAARLRKLVHGATAPGPAIVVADHRPAVNEARPEILETREGRRVQIDIDVHEAIVPFRLRVEAMRDPAGMEFDLRKLGEGVAHLADRARKIPRAAHRTDALAFGRTVLRRGVLGSGL